MPFLARPSSHDEEEWSASMIDTGEKAMAGGRLQRVLKFIRDQWLLDAAASLAASWRRLKNEYMRQKVKLQTADQKLKATTAKMESRVEKLKSELETFQPLLGHLHYRNEKGSS